MLQHLMRYADCISSRVSRHDFLYLFTLDIPVHSARFKRKSTSILLLWLCFVTLILSACGREPLYHSQSYVFGTLVDISIYGEQADRAAKLAGVIQQDFQRLHRKLHA